jgi:Cu+-exporting ATPase
MKDPVCGMEVEAASAAGSSVYHDQTYYFCSRGCKAAFDADPARYVGQAAHGGHGHESQRHGMH